MNRIMSFDPGVNSIAVATFDDGVLDWYFFTECDPKQAVVFLEIIMEQYHPNTVIIEVPQVYRISKGDPNDLVNLALMCGRIDAMARLVDAEVIHVRPRIWKGQRNKKADNAYTLSLLSATELAIFDRCKVIKSKKHNVIDAVGIGLWQLKRR